MDYAIVPREHVVAEGCAAAQAGALPTTCPYMFGTEHAYAWREGFVVETISLRLSTAQTRNLVNGVRA